MPKTDYISALNDLLGVEYGYYLDDASVSLLVQGLQRGERYEKVYNYIYSEILHLEDRLRDNKDGTYTTQLLLARYRAFREIYRMMLMEGK